jgi:Flp pilus assembly protein TadB
LEVKLMAFTAVAAVGVAISAYGTYTGMETSKKAARASRAAADAQRRQEDVAQQRERLKQVREARIRQAQVVQAGENQGVSGSSAIAGGVGDIGTQAAGNIGYTNAMQSAGNEIYNQNTIIRTANRQAQTAQGFTNFGKSLFSFGTGM